MASFFKICNVSRYVAASALKGMWRRVAVWLFVAVALVSYAEEGKYSDLLNEVSAFPSGRILEMAQKEERGKDTEKAMVLYMVVCNRSDDRMSDEEKELCSLAYFRTGYLHYENGRYTKALEFYVNGLKICESTKDKKYAARFYKDIGIIYNVFRDYEKGLFYLKKGENILRESPDPETEYKLLTSMFFNCLSLGDKEGLGEYHDKLVRLAVPETDLTRFMNRYISALLDFESGDYRKAIAMFSSLAGHARQTGIGPQYECSAYEWVYRSYWSLQEADSTLRYMERCKSISDSCGLHHKFPQVLHDMAELYEQQGNLSESQRYKAEYFTEMDSIFNTREFDIVKNGQSVYEMDKIDAEIKDLQVKKNQRETTIKFLIWIVAIIFVGALAVSVLLVWVYRQKSRLDESYRNLFSMNKRLAENHEQASAQYRECLDMLNRSEEEVRCLKKEISENRATDGKSPSNTGKDKERYNNSNLSEDMKGKILRDINEIMENSDEYCNDNFTLDRLAEMVGSNTRYVSQIINGTYGKNFNNFINEYRIRVACMRLADNAGFGNHTINAIGRSVGFKSNTTFTAVFKRLTGMTPSVYQKLAVEAADEKNSDADL